MNDLSNTFDQVNLNDIPTLPKDVANRLSQFLPLGFGSLISKKITSDQVRKSRICQKRLQWFKKRNDIIKIRSLRNCRLNDGTPAKCRIYVKRDYEKRILIYKVNLLTCITLYEGDLRSQTSN